jgi:hypothetical protein
MRTLIAPSIFVLALAGCGATRPARPLDPAQTPQGLVVHEWGTDTVVVGSDGSLQRGLHHEQEDLPAFVYDFRQGNGARMPSVRVKMETPVTYFYSDRAMEAKVLVRFPSGLFTQWFPSLDVIDANATITDGLADWGTIDILDRQASANLTDAPLDRYTWSFARNVASNPVQVHTPAGALEQEKFLFYRGLGNFAPPVTVTTDAKGALRLDSSIDDPIASVFVLDVAADGSGSFQEIDRAFSKDHPLLTDLAVPPPQGDYDSELSGALSSALTRAGLYADEAQAMVSTWQRQWFHTPGPRVLYLAPQSWTDGSIPLVVDPTPSTTIRVMVMRVELITPAIESQDLATARLLEADPGSAQVSAYFTALGRFAEPRFRRALQLLGDPSWGQEMLAQLAVVDTMVAGE